MTRACAGTKPTPSLPPHVTVEGRNQPAPTEEQREGGSALRDPRALSMRENNGKIDGKGWGGGGEGLSFPIRLTDENKPALQPTRLDPPSEQKTPGKCCKAVIGTDGSTHETALETTGERCQAKPKQSDALKQARQQSWRNSSLTLTEQGRDSDGFPPAGKRVGEMFPLSDEGEAGITAETPAPRGDGIGGRGGCAGRKRFAEINPGRARVSILHAELGWGWGLSPSLNSINGFKMCFWGGGGSLRRRLALGRLKPEEGAAAAR